MPQDSRPVFIIPWNHRPELLPSQKKLLEEQAAERNQPHERHHIFPQAFRLWFTREEIYRYAGQLIYEFELFGPVVPYWRQPLPQPPGY